MRHTQKCLFGLPAGDLAEIVLHLREEWGQLRGGRLFITGGTGFFGKWLLGALALANDEIELGMHLAVLSRDPARFLEQHPEAEGKFHFQRGDVTDFALPPGRCDYLIHGATDSSAITTQAQEEGRARAMIEGTRRMIELARHGHARRLLNISSGAVYGAASGKRSGAREDDPITPVTTYGRAKREAELLCAESGVEHTTVRPFAFLGPHLPLDAHYAAGNFLRDAQRGGPIEARGDGTALRSYLYPSDLIIWVLRLLVRGTGGRTCNIGSDEVVSTRELAERIAAARRPRPQVVVQAALPQGPQNIYLPDLTRARSEFGLEILVPLDDAVRRTLAWLDAR